MPLVRRSFDVEGTEWVAEVETDPKGLPYATMRADDVPDVEVSLVARSTRSTPTVTLRGPTRMGSVEARGTAGHMLSAADAADALLAHVLETYRLPTADVDGDPTTRAEAMLAVVLAAQAEGREASFEEMNEAALACSEPDSRTRIAIETDAVLNAAVTDDPHDREIAESLVADVSRAAVAYWRQRTEHEELLHAPPSEYDPDATRVADSVRTTRHNELVGAVLALSSFARSHGLDTWMARLADDRERAYRAPVREEIAQTVRPLADA